MNNKFSEGYDWLSLLYFSGLVKTWPSVASDTRLLAGRDGNLGLIPGVDRISTEKLDWLWSPSSPFARFYCGLVKGPGFKSDLFSSSNVQGNNECIYTYTAPYVFSPFFFQKNGDKFTIRISQPPPAPQLKSSHYQWLFSLLMFWSLRNLSRASRGFTAWTTTLSLN